jgi:putative flavoprotein involved in K+ transport
MTSLPARTDTVVVGAGQAGLAMSWYLRGAGRDHVVLDRRSTLGGGWQDRWDEFCLVSPNWTASLPGAPYDGGDPDGFMPRDEIVGTIARYATRIDAPVLLDTTVERLTRRADERFHLVTSRGTVVAERVVVATGAFHVPHVPAAARSLSPRVLSLHSQNYRREADLPSGAVLVVGSGQTGTQLAEELVAGGREVYLSVGTAGRVPRRYRGRDIFYWLHALAVRGEEVGTPLPTAATLPDPRRRFAGNPHLSGHDGGHEVNLRRLGRDGVVLMGRLGSIDGERALFADDLAANLAGADRFFEERFRDVIDRFIAASATEATDAEPRDVVDFEPTSPANLDLAGSGIATVIWTSGYRPDYGWIGLPVTDQLGLPRQVRGVSDVPGLFFIGSLWQHDQGSATLFGISRDARVLAERMGLTSAVAASRLPG